MQYRKLGNTPYIVSQICFGALTIGPLGAYLPLKEGAAVIAKALELGVNFIDTAQYYRTYPYIKEALDLQPKDIIIASKTYAETIPDLHEAVEEARRQLDRDKIEIFLLHEQLNAETVLEHRFLLEELHKLKEQGKIGAVGISTHNVGAAKIAAELDEIEVLHPLINKEGIGINGGTRDDMIAAIKACKNAGKGVYGMKSMGGGALMLKAREMQEWSLSRDFLDSCAIGMKTIDEVITNIGWAEGKEPLEAANVMTVDRNMMFDDCFGCGACIKACQQNALKLIDGKAQWYKENCLYCGYCIPACPHFFISFA